MFFSGEEIALKLILLITLLILIQCDCQLIFLSPNTQETHNDYKESYVTQVFFLSTVPLRRLLKL